MSKTQVSSYVGYVLTQEALPPKSYAPIGQGGPLRPRTPHPKPPCHPNSDQPTSGARETHATCQSTSCWNTSICIMFDIPREPFRRVSLPACLACHCSESRAPACLTFHSDESPTRIPCIPFRRVARSIKVDSKIASSSLRLQHT